jgi:hypothetical protein
VQRCVRRRVRRLLRDSDGSKVSVETTNFGCVGLCYAFTAFGQQGYVSLRGYWEFWAQNRLAGHAAFLPLSIPLGAGS